jgi:hypothetical protein
LFFTTASAAHVFIDDEVMLWRRFGANRGGVEVESAPKLRETTKNNHFCVFFASLPAFSKRMRCVLFALHV